MMAARESSRRRRRRCGGSWTPSGTATPPALATASIATIAHADFSKHRPTMDSSTTPRAVR